MPDTETVKLTPEEKKAVDEGQKITSDFVKRIGQPGALDVPADQLVADDGSRVLVTAPRAFILTLNDHRRVKFHVGINDVPVKSLEQVVAAHDYVKANGATIYNAPKAVTALGGNTLPDMVLVGDASIPVQQFISAAQLTSGLSIDAWNQLKPEARDDMVARVIKARQDTIVDDRVQQAKDDKAAAKQDAAAAAAKDGRKP